MATMIPGAGWSGATAQPDPVGMIEALSFDDGVWNSSASTLTKAGAFSGYTHTAGDRIYISAGTGFIHRGGYQIVGKVDDDTLELALVGDESIANTSDVQAWAIAPAGYDAKCMARWSHVPYQDIAATLNIGIVAFHMNGIEKVEIAVNGGAWVEVTAMTLNTETGVWEYWATLDAADFDQAEVAEVRARIWPNDSGIPRVLGGIIHDIGVSQGAPRNGEHSLFFSMFKTGIPTTVSYVDSVAGDDDTGDGTSETPYQSIIKAATEIQSAQSGNAGGGTIYLKAGNHPWVGWSAFGSEGNVPQITSHTRWLTITRAPGLDLADVSIVTGAGFDGQGLRAHLVRVAGITVTRSLPTASLDSSNGNPILWYDACTIDLGDATTEEATASGSYADIYGTDTLVRRVRNAVLQWSLARTVACDQVGADAFREMRCVINCEVSNIGGYGLAEHPDVFQWFIPTTDVWDNIVVYGLQAIDNINAQPFLCRIYNDEAEIHNAAFVNVLIASKTHAGQFSCPGHHHLWWHITIANGSSAPNAGLMMFRNDSSGSYNFARWANLSIRNSAYYRISWTAAHPSPAAAVPAANNHFVINDIGEDFTTGGMLFTDPPEGDYRPGSNSPLAERGAPLVPADVDGNARGVDSAIGALEASETPVSEFDGPINSFDAAVSSLTALIRHYRLNETEGATAVDATGNAGAPYVDGPTLAQKNLTNDAGNLSVLFNGTSQWVVEADNEGPKNGNLQPPITVGVVCEFVSLPSVVGIIAGWARQNSDDPFYTVGVDDSGNAIGRFSGAGGTEVITGPALTTGKRYLIVGIASSGTVRKLLVFNITDGTASSTDGTATDLNHSTTAPTRRRFSVANTARGSMVSPTNVYATDAFMMNAAMSDDEWDRLVQQIQLPSAPDAPPAPFLEEEEGGVLVTGNPPAFDGNSPITGYHIERESPVAGGWSTLVADTSLLDPPPALDPTLGLEYLDTTTTGGTEYNYRVSAINAEGESDPSGATSIVTDAEPIATSSSLCYQTLDNPKGDGAIPSSSTGYHQAMLTLSHDDAFTLNRSAGEPPKLYIVKDSVETIITLAETPDEGDDFNAGTLGELAVLLRDELGFTVAIHAPYNADTSTDGLIRQSWASSTEHTLVSDEECNPTSAATAAAVTPGLGFGLID